jgi:hypothetical protein
MRCNPGVSQKSGVKFQVTLRTTLMRCASPSMMHVTTPQLAAATIMLYPASLASNASSTHTQSAVSAVNDSDLT